MAKIREEFEKWQQQVSTLTLRLEAAEARATAAEEASGAKSPEFMAMQAQVGEMTAALAAAQANLSSLSDAVAAHPVPPVLPSPTPEPPTPEPQTRAARLGWV